MDVDVSLRQRIQDTAFDYLWTELMIERGSEASQNFKVTHRLRKLKMALGRYQMDLYEIALKGTAYLVNSRSGKAFNLALQTTDDKISEFGDAFNTCLTKALKDYKQVLLAYMEEHPESLSDESLCEEARGLVDYVDKVEYYFYYRKKSIESDYYDEVYDRNKAVKADIEKRLLVLAEKYGAMAPNFNVMNQQKRNQFLEEIGASPKEKEEIDAVSEYLFSTSIYGNDEDEEHKSNTPLDVKAHKSYEENLISDTHDMLFSKLQALVQKRAHKGIDELLPYYLTYRLYRALSNGLTMESFLVDDLLKEFRSLFKKDFLHVLVTYETQMDTVINDSCFDELATRVIHLKKDTIRKKRKVIEDFLLSL